MNYYETIKQEFISNEIYKRVKDYSKNQNDLKTYYNVGKMLCEAGKHYGEGIIREYSKKLTVELGKGYTQTRLKYMRQFYIIMQKSPTVSDKLSYSHYCEIMWLNIDEINYYIKIVEEQNLSVRELRERIKSKEYERLDDKTKLKLKNQNNLEIKDFIKNPIILKTNQEILKERALQQLILEDLPSFMKELGPGFSFIENEYKIKIGNVYNYIDLLLFNYIYQCFVVVELKVIELKKEHIGQIETYMHYIDKNLKTNKQDKTIGIILTKKDNRFIMEYCSDKRVLNITYSLQTV
jgi:hypothetical protein